MKATVKIRSHALTGRLLTSASALVMVAATPAIAQQTPAATGTPTASAADIVVTGIRGSLQSSQNVKRRSATVVDVVTAEDIGALPDRSVTETLQRIPGVQVSRFAAVNDPDHFASEGQGAVIRGLPFVLSQFNGRDAFTANRGRAINFQDIPPQLLSRVEVYKNQTADQVEGGIAGVVNLVTRLPLDRKANVYAFIVNGNYGNQSKKLGTDISGVVTQQWETGSGGRFGILVGGSYSKLYTQQDSAKVTSWAQRCNVGAGCPITTANPTGGIGAPLAGLTPGTIYYVPVGGGTSRQNYDLTRIGANAALEYESAGGELHATLQFLHTQTKNVWTENTFAAVEDTSQGSVRPLAGTSFTFDSLNRLQTGTISDGNWASSAPPTGVQQQVLKRGVIDRTRTNDFSGHVTWKATDRFTIDLDGQYADSYADNLDVSVFNSTWAQTKLDLTGNVPQVTLIPPAGANYTSFADPKSTFQRATMDHQDNNFGREFAFRADGDYKFDDDSFLKRVKFGARYADRQQRIRSDGYNWGNLSEVWNGGGPVFASQVSPAYNGVYNFGTVADGAAVGGQSVVTYPGNPAEDYAIIQARARAVQAIVVASGGFAGWTPLGARPGVISVANGGDGFHTAGEISTNGEKTFGLYGRLDFGADLGGGARFDGNVGLRWVRTTTTSTGAVNFPTPGTFGNVVCPPTSPINGPNICLNTPTQRAALIAFANSAFQLNGPGQSYNHFLPSVNLRLAPTDELQFRFAYSRAITRPSFNDLRNFVSFAVTPTASGTPVSGFDATAAGNPLLKPTVADNFDLTAEYYFSPVGSITLSAFYKRLQNVSSVTNGVGQALLGAPIGGGTPSAASPSGTQTYTNNGVTQVARFFGPTNDPNSINVKGFEIAYQQTFTFLPAPFNGLGFQGNFSYIDADPITTLANNYLGQPGYAQLPFPGVSKYNVNAVLFYEVDKFSARAAYSWRSSYLVTGRDVNYPTQPVYSGATGQLDASMFYNLTRNIKVGIEGNNVLGAINKTYSQINAQGLQGIRAAYRSDRRVTFGIRADF